MKVTLNSRSFAYYDVNAKKWRAEKGAYTVELGTSSEQIELKTKVTLAADKTE